MKEEASLLHWSSVACPCTPTRKCPSAKNHRTRKIKIDLRRSEKVEGGQPPHVYAIKGEVLRVEGDTYFVKGEEGKEVGLQTDHTTQKTGDIQPGHRIEAQRNEDSERLGSEGTRPWF